MTADTTKTFSLPFLQPGQTLKTITHNEALQRLDTGLYMSVSEMAAAELPLEPEDGHTLILSDTPTLDLAAHSGNIAVYRAGDWTWFKPSPGWIIWDSTDQELRVFDGNIWVSGSHQTTADMLPKLGVNTSAQEHQRLAVASPSSLFTHSGDSHRLSINRAEAADTASLIFQTNYTGQAEFGLTGTSGISLKTSPDGLNWTDRFSAPNDYPAIQAQAFGSKRILIDSDTAAFIPTPATGGILAMTIISDSGSPRADRSGIFAYDTGQTPRLVSLAATPLLINHEDVILDGTVGERNRIGISAVEGGLYIENKIATQREVSLTYLC